MRGPPRLNRLAPPKAGDNLVRRVRADPFIQPRKIEHALHGFTDRRIDEHQDALKRDGWHCQRFGGDQQRLTRWISVDALRLLVRQAECISRILVKPVRSRPSAAASSARLVST